MSIGLTMPFAQATGSIGWFQTTEDELSAVHENLRSLAHTNWGERPMHFNLGFNLIEFLFSPVRDDEFRTMISDRAVSQIGRWMPFVRVDQVIVRTHDDDIGIPDNGVRVQIKYGLTGRPDLRSQLLIVQVPS
jgi:phage baseplate assembly protein W